MCIRKLWISPLMRLKVAMTTQIAIGNLAEQPVYEKFVERRYITKALQTMH